MSLRIRSTLLLLGGYLFIQTLNAQQISLSFDDAPRGQGPIFNGEKRTEQLIKSLRAAESPPVVFFVLTKSLDRERERKRIKRYTDAGHLIANHTHTHPWLHKTELNDYLSDLDQADNLLQDFPNRRPWFRFPYLDEGRQASKRDAARQALADRQLMNGYVTIDNYDWYLESRWEQAVGAGMHVELDALREVYLKVLLSAVEFYDSLARDKLGRSPAHTLLLHENDLAALFVGDLIGELRKRGWEIIDPDTAYKDPIAKIEPQTLRTSQGRVAALAVDAGADPRSLTHLAIEESLIDALLEKHGVFSEIMETPDRIAQ